MQPWIEAIVELLSHFGKGAGHSVLFTRLAPEVFAQAPEAIRSGYDYHPLSRPAFGDSLPPKSNGRVAVVSAGTADGFVAWEAVRTLAYLGIRHKIFEDCGVAGLWRLAERLDEINAFDAIIVVAGLDAALVSVMGGLTPKPIFGVPTSVGYGVAQGGNAALASMLSSCAPGVSIMNIDNGYSAACAAARCVHGIIPVPAPAVLELLENIPVRPFPGEGETVTPTAVALLRSLGATFGPWPDMLVERLALVYGSRVFANAPNGTIFACGSKYVG
jgi:NCAIR mutase (PurE)-related protein